MYSIKLLNKNGRLLREYKGMDMPDDMDSALDLIWLGMAAACTTGRIVVTDETTEKEVMNKAYIK